MGKKQNNLLWYVIIITLALVIGACFIISMFVIENYAKEDCFEHIEDSTQQTANMFEHTMMQNRNQLTMFADILASNIGGNTPELLDAYMENFCDTQNFSAVCIHRKEGEPVYSGVHPHDQVNISSFADEVKNLPYVSEVISTGDNRSQKYIYDAVPINNKDGETIAILYGYISLDTFPSFVSSTAYDGKCKFYIVDGNTGDFLMNEYTRYNMAGNEIPLGNIFEDDLKKAEIGDGYSLENIRADIERGKKGFFVFKSDISNDSYYTHYMPIGINNWSMQMTIDESTAFSTYSEVRDSIIALMVCVITFLIAFVLILLLQNIRARRLDNESLRKADYVNAVQSALISAHNNPDFVDRALHIIADEMVAETVLLLTFKDKVITQAQYWPSKDKSQAMALIGVNIREVFPSFFDSLSSGASIVFDGEKGDVEISNDAEKMFVALSVKNIVLVPITDNAGTLKGTIAAINLPESRQNPEALECVTRDFFMAITNLENHNIIKRMGAIDYLTGLKNRNSFESELAEYEVKNADSLWCIFVDVNGLHELNNKMGHKAGDLMLCTVADVIKKIFGEEYTYRLGGDEFVAFKLDSTHEEFMAAKYRMIDEITKKGYSVSAGFECVRKNENNIFDVDKVVADAETIMYRDKRRYYEENDLPTERGRFQNLDKVNS